VRLLIDISENPSTTRAALELAQSALLVQAGKVVPEVLEIQELIDRIDILVATEPPLPSPTRMYYNRARLNGKSAAYLKFEEALREQEYQAKFDKEG
jgi:hypothetical protein